MNVFTRILAPGLTAATILATAGAQAAPQGEVMLSGFVAGMAIGAWAATAPSPPPPPPLYVYPAPTYWAPEPRATYAYHAGAWHPQPYAEADDDADDWDE